jgi:hypothetical protein
MYNPLYININKNSFNITHVGKLNSGSNSGSVSSILPALKKVYGEIFGNGGTE